MADPKTVLLVPYLVTGATLIGLSIPLIKGRIPPNGWYGFRVKRTMENPEIWYPANRYAAYHLLALGVALLITATALYLVPQVGLISYALACLAVTMGGVAVGLIRSFRRLRQLQQGQSGKSI